MKLDFGCGTKKQDGHHGVDAIKFDGVDYQLDCGTSPFPWRNEEIEGAYSSHFVEHLTGSQRVHFFNELYRVLKPGAQVTIITPHWSNDCAYGDPTHQWPPISEWTFQYLDKAWRDINAPHVGFTCDFQMTYGYGVDQSIAARNQEHQQFAIRHYRNAARDLHVTLTKR